MTSITISLPCPEGGLPTKADLTNMFNEIAAIPSDIQAKLDELKQQVATDAEETLDRIRKLEDEIATKAGEERARLEADLEALKNGEDPLRIVSEFEGKIKQVEDMIDDVATLFEPYWEKGKTVRQLEKEAEDAFTELVQEFHIFIPVKMMEMISKIIPVEFAVPVMGLSIDVLRLISEPSYQEELKAQISGWTEEYTTKLKTLQQDLESGKLEQDAYDSALGRLEEEKAKILDKFYMLVPEQYRLHDGEFGVICEEWKAKLTWSYIKNEIMEWCTMSLFKLFEKLIGKFKEIWDALGLPDLPIPLSFDMAEWVRAIIDAVVEKYQEERNRILGDLEKLQNLDVEQELKDAQTELENELNQIGLDMIDEILETSIPLPAPFDITLNEVFGGEIEGKVTCLEERINQIVTAARDWKIITMKELFNIWLRKIKKFLDAIGLGKLLEFLDLTLCDVMELIGLPLQIEIPLPDLSVIGMAPLNLAAEQVSHRVGGVTLPSLDDITAPNTDNMTEEEFQEFVNRFI